MSRQIYVNLPVEDLKRSVEFFTRLGFTFDPRLTDENTACMVVGDGTFVMLVTENLFQTFTDRPVCIARKSTEVVIGLSCASRAEVDEMVGKAIEAGGTAPRPPQDLGFMYEHDFQDPDGHIWEAFHMQPA